MKNTNKWMVVFASAMVSLQVSAGDNKNADDYLLGKYDSSAKAAITALKIGGGSYLIKKGISPLRLSETVPLANENTLSAAMEARSSARVRLAEVKNFAKTMKGSGLVKFSALVGSGTVLIADGMGMLYEWRANDGHPHYSPMLNWIKEQTVGGEKIPSNEKFVQGAEKIEVGETKEEQNESTVEFVEKKLEEKHRALKLTRFTRNNVPQEAPVVAEEAPVKVEDHSAQASVEVSAEPVKEAKRPGRVAESLRFGADMGGIYALKKSVKLLPHNKAELAAQDFLVRAKYLTPDNGKLVAYEVANRREQLGNKHEWDTTVDVKKLKSEIQELESKRKYFTPERQAVLIRDAEKNLNAVRKAKLEASGTLKGITAVRVFGEGLLFADAAGCVYRWLTNEAEPQVNYAATAMLLKSGKEPQEVFGAAEPTKEGYMERAGLAEESK